MKTEIYQDTGPQLRLEEYFLGHTKAWGIVQDRSGKVIRSFTATMEGKFEGDLFVLEEAFVFDDGEQSTRTWRVSQTGPNQYSGNAGDVIGEAYGEAYGNAVHWRYQLDLKVKDRYWTINFDDWMFRLVDDRVINKATMSKWGFRVGELTLFFEKQAPAT